MKAPIKNPKLSIITINYNNCEGLKETLQSIASQIDTNFEYIIIDGGSSDGSVDVIQEFEHVISYWVSEPDNGIYNAMNKGMKIASGIYCQFLNSGDSLYDSEVTKKFNNCSHNDDIMVGGTEFFYLNSNKKSMVVFPCRQITLAHLVYKAISHQASFIRRQLLCQHPYDENFKIVSDYKFWIETLILQNNSYRPLDFMVCKFNDEGISSTQGKLNAEERGSVLRSLIPPRILSDYCQMDFDTVLLAKELHKYDKFRKSICKLNMFLISIYDKLLSLKIKIKN